MEHNGIVYPSHRNRVTAASYMGQPAVKKEYLISHETYLVERANLSRLTELGFSRIPRILYEEEDVLYLSHLPGTPYTDLIPQMEQDTDFAVKAMDALIRSVTLFHDLCGCRRGDVNLRNFLFDGTDCYWVDFEDPLCPGAMEADLGGMLAYLVTYSPPCTPQKLELGRIFFRCAAQNSIESDGIRAGYLEELNRILYYRGTRFAPIAESARDAFCAMVPSTTGEESPIL